NLRDELPEFYRTNLEQALAEGIPLEIEDYYTPLNIWFAVRVYPSHAGLSVYFHNVTERKQAEETLRQSEERLRLALDAGNAGVWDWDMVNNHVTWSERIYEFHGLTPETFDGTVENFMSLIHPEERERVATAIQKAIEDKVPYHIEFRAIQPGGVVRWISTNGRVIYDATGKPVRMLGATIDTTERKTAEQEREQLLDRERTTRAEAEAANRIKDEFLTVLSHELRTPLNPILGWSKLLQSGKCNGETMTRAVDAIERNAKLQKQLIEDLLDVSQMLQGKLSLNVSSVNLVSIIQATIETLHLAAQAKSIQIQTVLEPNLGLVSGDPNRLQQVVWNLISNAIKFTPSGGRVEIRLSAIAQATGNYAQIQVIDTGYGINSEFLPFVFDRFRQADSTTTRSVGGLGIGLSLVRYLVELHGGTVQAESPGEGEGATFTVTLPLRSVWCKRMD
ncbi:MAG TPA: PAS domain-containing sensor histidine kinase, partial [Coleofasciculaceae cyanobacterium]